MKAFLLAAGFGTRLRPLTLHRPKPLVPVCGLPMLDYALALVQRHGLGGAVVNAHWLPEQVAAWAAAQSVPLTVSVEAPAILGTGGGLRKALPDLSERFVVVNGDILCDVDLRALLDAVPEAGAAMALRVLQSGERYGVVASDGEVVTDLVGLARCAARGTEDRSTHFTGVHAMSRAALQRVPAQGEACVVRSAYTELVPQRLVAARPHAGTWFDVGTPAAWLRANLEALRGTLSLPIDPWSRVGWGVDARGREHGRRDAVASVQPAGAAWIGPGAVVEPGAVLGPDVVVGAGAVVRSGARLARAVVWDGVVVPPEVALRGGCVHDGGVLAIDAP